MTPQNFNIRVYGILKNVNHSFLMTNEIRGGVKMTKFVGGGLEFNESIKECLKREFLEEMNLKIEVLNLFYINDFLQISAFNSNDQLLSIYYFVTTKDWNRVEECILNPTNEQTFFWITKNKLQNLPITFPIDKVVVNKLLQ